MSPRDSLVNLALRLVVLAAALLIPLVFYLAANEVFELCKSSTLKVFGLLAAVLLMWRGTPVQSRSFLGVGLLLAAGVLSMPNTPSLTATLERLWEFGSIAILLIAAESTPVPAGRLLAVVLWGYVLVMIYATFQYFGFDAIGWKTFGEIGENRVYSTMGNPDFLAAQSSLLLPVLFCLALGFTRIGAGRVIADLRARLEQEGIYRLLGGYVVRGLRLLLLFTGLTVGIAGPILSLLCIVFPPVNAEVRFIIIVVGAAALALGVMVPFFRVTRSDIRHLVIIAFCLILPSLLYAQARGALLGFAVAALVVDVLVFVHVIRVPLLKLLGWHAAVAGVVAVLIFSMPIGQRMVNRFAEFKDPLKSQSIQIRLFYWYSGWLMGINSQLNGSGLGAFHLAGAKAQGQAQQIWNHRWPRAAEAVSPHLELYAHNDYVHLFAEIGPLGLGIYLWIMVSLLAAGLNGLRRLAPEKHLDRCLLIGLLSATVAFYVNSLTNFPLKVIPNAHLFFACLSAIVLGYSSLKLFTLRLPQHHLALVGALIAALYLSERACTKLIASQYLKSGHVALNESMKAARAGRVNLAKEQTDASFTFFGHSAALRPDHKDAILVHYYAGRSHHARGELNLAIAAFTRSISVFKYFPEAYKDRGLVYLNQAKSEQDPAAAAMHLNLSLRDLAQSRFLNPKDPLTCLYLGLARRKHGDHAGAVAPLLDAIKYSSDPPIPDAHYALALTYIELNQLAEARLALQTMLAAFPNQPAQPAAQALLDRLTTK